MLLLLETLWQIQQVGVCCSRYKLKVSRHITTWQQRWTQPGTEDTTSCWQAAQLHWVSLCVALYLYWSRQSSGADRPITVHGVGHCVPSVVIQQQRCSTAAPPLMWWSSMWERGKQEELLSYGQSSAFTFKVAQAQSASCLYSWPEQPHRKYI